MKRRLCAAILTFEAIVLGLTTPVLISVQDVGTAKALWIGLGLTVLCLLTAGLLRREWAYWLGWLIQVAAVALGFEIRVMFALGVVFLVLWLSAYLLGQQIDSHQQAARLQQRAQQPAAEPADDGVAGLVPPVRGWDHELVCGPETWRPFARRAVRSLWTPRAVAWSAGGLLLGLLALLLLRDAPVVGIVLVAAVVLFPVVGWLTQRLAWRSFLAPGRSYRTSFGPAGLVLEADGRLFEVAYDDIRAVRAERGLVSAELDGATLDLPEVVFPDAQVERVRAVIAARVTE